MWQGQVYILSILIAVLSGALPHVKLILMTALWVLDSKRFDPVLRGMFLTWLDRLGKWALIDFQLLVVMAVAFH